MPAWIPLHNIDDLKVIGEPTLIIFCECHSNQMQIYTAERRAGQGGIGDESPHNKGLCQIKP